MGQGVHKKTFVVKCERPGGYHFNHLIPSQEEIEAIKNKAQISYDQQHRFQENRSHKHLKKGINDLTVEEFEYLNKHPIFKALLEGEKPALILVSSGEGKQGE